MARHSSVGIKDLCEIFELKMLMVCRVREKITNRILKNGREIFLFVF